MRTQLVLLAIMAVAFASDIESFKQFMSKYNKNYESIAETKHRFGIFQENLKVIEALNQKHASATFGITKFADMTTQEFKAKYLSPFDMKEAFDPSWPVADLYSPEHIQALPDSVDWRQKGAVTPVKNQEQCGSCWAFSAIGNLEGQWFLAGHNLTGLSEQNLVDCDHTCLNGGCDAGCDGGLMPNAWTYIMNNGGVDTEDSYPYLGVDSTCDYSAANIGATVTNWTMIQGDEDQMAAYCVANGPISIAVDAVDWQFYEFGIFEFPWCGTTLDHGVLIVGYDHEVDWFGQDLPFWWVKNSWGEDWGYDGYIKLAKGSDQCGDNLFPCSSIV